MYMYAFYMSKFITKTLVSTKLSTFGPGYSRYKPMAIYGWGREPPVIQNGEIHKKKCHKDMA